MDMKNCDSQPRNLNQQDKFRVLIQKLDALLDQRNGDNAKLLELQNKIKDLAAIIQALQAQIVTKPTFAENTKVDAAVPAQAMKKISTG